MTIPIYNTINSNDNTFIKTENLNLEKLNDLKLKKVRTLQSDEYYKDKNIINICQVNHNLLVVFILYFINFF